MLLGACTPPAPWQTAYLQTTLYVTALGVVGIRPCVSSFGTDQFDERDPRYERRLDRLFNLFYLAVTVGAIAAFTAVVYIQMRMRLLHHQFLAAAAIAVFFLAPMAAQPQLLRPDYYAGVCPDLEGIVRGAVQQSVALSPFAAPATLRLFFHDCAIRGCDASVLLINPGGDDEWRSPDGMTLKLEGFSTVMNAKAAVDSDPRCRNRVSCADILALAARDSVFLSGGPDYEVELGRFDGRASTGGSVVVPHGMFNLDELNAFFSSLGLNQTDMIALSGSSHRERGTVSRTTSRDRTLLFRKRRSFLS